MSNHSVIEVRNLSKRYGSFSAVDTISFSIPKGQVMGFLGPNGAGKTTTIQMLMGITKLTSGQIFFFGKDFTKHREECLQRINYTSAYNNLQGKISVMENLLVYS